MFVLADAPSSGQFQRVRSNGFLPVSRQRGVTYAEQSVGLSLRFKPNADDVGIMVLRLRGR